MADPAVVPLAGSTLDPARGARAADPVVPLARSTLDRAAHRRTDAEWLAGAWHRSRVLVVERGRVLAADGRLVLVTPDRAPAGERLFLGLDPDGVPYFAVAGSLSDVDVPAGAERAGIHEVGLLLPEFEAGLLVTAVAITNFHAVHPYSPRTGKSTTARDGGWVRGDGDGGDVWPRTDPAVIVLVHDGVPGDDGRCLLGQNAAWLRGGGGTGVPRYSCLAGFVEPGESAEQTVLREVAEEVGVDVREPRYLGSQAWPYPASLMLGFHALADPEAPLRLDPTEIVAARWFTRREIRAAIEDPDGQDFGVSPPASIAYFLLVRWLRAE